MLKNKIYNYLTVEIIKNFVIVLFTFSAIAWVVRAVNFLDLMVEDGYNSSIYFKYSILNITAIVTRFIPLAFLLSLTISIIKFERQKELIILWTFGLNKIKITNIFLLIAFGVTLLQLILSLFVNPYLLNKSRSLLKNSEELQINSILRSNDFSDTFKGLTFYIERKNTNKELINIFIKDTAGNLSTVLDKVGKSQDTTIFAKKGFISKKKLILFDGVLQVANKENEFKNIKFEKTELSLINLATRTIIQPKIQETSSRTLLNCVFNRNNNLNLNNCVKGDYQRESVQTLSRRIGEPLYIPLISIITSFLLIYKKEKKFIFLKKYILFSLSFLMLVLAQILLKYTGFSYVTAASYFAFPVITSILFYTYLRKKMHSEKVL
jgi:lipopolysaccharide export system permease protein